MVRVLLVDQTGIAAIATELGQVLLLLNVRGASDVRHVFFGVDW